MQFFKNPGIVIRFGIAIGYVLLSILILLSPVAKTILSDNMKYIFSALLFVYGIFRCYRAYQLYKETEA